MKQQIEEIIKTIRFPIEYTDKENNLHYWKIPWGNKGWFVTDIRGYENYQKALRKAADKYIKDMEDFVKRLITEESELSEKIEKLGLFLDTEKFKELDIEMQNLMIEQYNYMHQYDQVLVKRIALLNNDED